MKPYYEHDGIVIYHGDCREVLPTLPKVDLVLADPPYGNSYASAGFRASTKSGRSECRPNYGGIGIALNNEVPDLGQVFAASENQIIWGGNYFILPPSPGWIVWDKRCDPKFYGITTFADCELAWCSDGKPARIHRQIWNGLVREGESGDRMHPTQKPIRLMQFCLERFPHSSSVLDPYMGSGTTLVACKRLGRRAIGIEIEEKYCEIAAKRLEKERLTLFEYVDEQQGLSFEAM